MTVCAALCSGMAVFNNETPFILVSAERNQTALKSQAPYQTSAAAPSHPPRTTGS